MGAALVFLQSLVGVLTNPAALLLIISAYAVGHFAGGRAASDVCDVAALNARIAALTMDREAAEAAARRFEAEAEANASQAEKNAAILQEIIRADQTPACLLSDDDARRVYGIR
jgi:outer membrane murein-binding lipoprotein Lpp